MREHKDVEDPPVSPLPTQLIEAQSIHKVIKTYFYKKN